MLGAAVVDVVARVPAFPQIDGIVLADRVDDYPGGSGGNIASGIAHLGCRSGFLGKVGDDEEGRWLIDQFIEDGVITRWMKISPGGRTASCFIAVDRSGQRQIYALGGTALLESPEEIDPASLENCRIVVITDAYLDTAIKAAQLAAAKGAETVFAPGGLMVSLSMIALEPILQITNVLVISQGEALTLTGCRNLESAAAVLLTIGPKVVIITLGKDGALFCQNHQLVHLPSFPVSHVEDTTGAGDAFVSGIAAGRLHGLDWIDAARAGCASAAKKVAHSGARGGQASWKDIELALQITST